MNTKTHSFFIALLCLMGFTLSCTSDKSVHQKEQRNHLTIQKPDKVQKVIDGVYIASLTIKDIVLPRQEEVKDATLSLIIVDNKATGLYLSEGPLKFSVAEDDPMMKTKNKADYIVIEDEIMMKTIIEDDIVLKSDYVDNIELRWIAEDHIMMMALSMDKTVIASSFITIHDEVL